MEITETFAIGIVGFGPKGFYGFERLIAYLREHNIDRSIQIHIFNNTSFLASGDVYRTDQPEYLIMNYANRNINGWILQEPYAPATSTPDFISWLTENRLANAAPNEYAPRAIVGKYLEECYQLVLDQLPSNVRVVPHIGTVSNVFKRGEEYQVKYTEAESGKENSIQCNSLLFTTGHHTFTSLKNTTSKENGVDFIYPVEEKLKPINKDSLVAIKGFGLTAIDAILALTEGRQGVFERKGNGEFKYELSGREPIKIYPFSRTGLPMVPRNGAPNSNAELHFFTDDLVRHLKKNKPVSFKCTILPLIKKEFYFAYYKVLFKNHGHQFYFDDDFTVIENQVQYFHEDFPECPVFNWEAIVDPFRDEPILSSIMLQYYLEFLIEEAKRGEEESPFMAAVSVWRKISPLFNELYSFGGLDAASQKEFDTYYFGLFNRLSYGPPVKNMEKMLALYKSGILDFSFVKSANISENTLNNNYTLQIKNARKTEINYYLNATISRAKEGEFKNELYQNLLKNGLVREFKNKLNTSYNPGCIEINKDGNAIDAKGRVDKNITFYGTPTEGITCDNDTLSRTKNNFASVWAKGVCTSILNKAGITEKYEREENVL